MIGRPVIAVIERRADGLDDTTRLVISMIRPMSWLGTLWYHIARWRKKQPPAFAGTNEVIDYTIELDPNVAVKLFLPEWAGGSEQLRLIFTPAVETKLGAVRREYRFKDPRV